MSSTIAVLAADCMEDYALAVTAASAVARKHGLAQCYPVLANGESETFPQVVHAYQVEWLRLDELFPATSPVERGHRIRASLFSLRAEPVYVAPGTTLDRIAASVLQCLRGSRPLDFDHRANTVTESDPLSSPDVLLLKRDSRHSIAAAYYACSTGKSVRFVDEWQADLDASLDASIASYLLVDDYAAFHKSLLARIVENEKFRQAPLGTGILTAFDEAAFTRLVVRILLTRDAPVMPAGLEHYRVITEHGNEMHMELDGGEFLCGAASGEDSSFNDPTFDCRPTCPHTSRRPAASLRVQHLLISSCNTFTLGDGVVGPEFSLLFRMMDGWCCSVMAPLKHALTGVAIPLLIEALARSGCSLGALAERLNSIAAYGADADPAYVLLGDPATIVSPPSLELQQPDAHLIGDSMALAGNLLGRCAAEWQLPPTTLRAVAARNDDRIAIVPLCSGLRSPDVYFAFRRRPDSDRWNLLLFSDRELPRTRVQLAVIGSAGVPSWLHVHTLDRIRELYRMQAFGIAIEIIQDIEAGILSQLRFGIGYPRLVEYLVGELMIRNLGSILEEQLTQARHTILDQLIELTADRLWLSQRYGRHYSSVRRAPSGTAPCPYCVSETTPWHYADEVTGRTSRTLMICARCGIIADHPTESPLHVSMGKLHELPLAGVTVTVSVSNRSETPLHVAVIAHFHEWRNLGISRDGEHVDLQLMAGQTAHHEFVFHFEKPFGDYMQDIHVFTLTGNFELSCHTQKLTSTHRALQQRGLVGIVAAPFAG